MAGTNLLIQLATDAAADTREQPWKAYVSREAKSGAGKQGLVEMVKVGGEINVMTNLL
jgi:hypothetical protein